MRTTLQTKAFVALIVSSVLVIATIFALSINKRQALGNISPGDQLRYVSVKQLTDGTNLCPNTNYQTTGYASSTTGTLGSVHMLSLSPGDLAVYDATTTNINLRSSDQATTSIIIAWFPAGTGTSTYAFNAQFNRGLLVDYTATVGTSTLTYRCGS